MSTASFGSPLIVWLGPRRYVFAAGRDVTVGPDRGADIQLDGVGGSGGPPLVVLHFNGNQWIAVDRSEAGIYVDGVRMSTVFIHHGRAITLGDPAHGPRLVFELAAPSAAPPPPRVPPPPPMRPQPPMPPRPLPPRPVPQFQPPPPPPPPPRPVQWAPPPRPPAPPPPPPAHQPAACAAAPAPRDPAAAPVAVGSATAAAAGSPGTAAALPGARADGERR